MPQQPDPEYDLLPYKECTGAPYLLFLCVCAICITICGLGIWGNLCQIKNAVCNPNPPEVYIDADYPEQQYLLYGQTLIKRQRTCQASRTGVGD